MIHGHYHNNDLETYPFVAYDERRVNVGVEILDYRPISLDTLTTILQGCTTGTYFRDAEDAIERFDDSN